MKIDVDVKRECRMPEQDVKSIGIMKYWYAVGIPYVGNLLLGVDSRAFVREDTGIVSHLARVEGTGRCVINGVRRIGLPTVVEIIDVPSWRIERGPEAGKTARRIKHICCEN